jgi:hypothetical protein
MSWLLRGSIPCCFSFVFSFVYTAFHLSRLVLGLVPSKLLSTPLPVLASSLLDAGEDSSVDLRGPEPRMRPIAPPARSLASLPNLAFGVPGEAPPGDCSDKLLRGLAVDRAASSAAAASTGVGACLGSSASREMDPNKRSSLKTEEPALLRPPDKDAPPRPPPGFLEGAARFMWVACLGAGGRLCGVVGAGTLLMRSGGMARLGGVDSDLTWVALSGNFADGGTRSGETQLVLFARMGFSSMAGNNSSMIAK